MLSHSISTLKQWLEKRLSLQNMFIFLLLSLAIILAIIFVRVMVSDDFKAWTFRLLGLPSKSEVLKFIGIGIGGVLIALQALMSYKRAKAMEDTVSNTEQGLRQERMKNAIEHLGHDKDSVRLGGAYELFHLAEDTRTQKTDQTNDSAYELFHLAEDTPELRQTLLDILCAHIRQTTGESAYQKTHQSKPSEEVQGLLTLLFVQDHEVFKGYHINLQESWLHGSDLREARLEEAVLIRACLQGAELREANLQRAYLNSAQMQGVVLGDANLQGANLWKANLQGANLWKANLQGANLGRAQMQEVALWEANLQGANLGRAQMQEAILWEANLQGVICKDRPFFMFEDRIRESIGKETDTSGVIFEGGLSREEVDSIVEGLSDDRAKVLRKKLEPHIGTPSSSQLPENSGAITGTYSKEEAEKWIAEYNKATSTGPTKKENA